MSAAKNKKKVEKFLNGIYDALPRELKTQEDKRYITGSFKGLFEVQKFIESGRFFGKTDLWNLFIAHQPPGSYPNANYQVQVDEEYYRIQQKFPDYLKTKVGEYLYYNSERIEELSIDPTAK